MKRLFTPTGDIGLTLISDYEVGPVNFSPDNRWFAVVTERGRLDINKPEDTIWMFNIEETRGYLQHPLA